MSRRPRSDYDTDEFRQMWFSDATLAEMARAYGVSIPSIWRAAARRGLPNRTTIRAEAA